MEERTPTYAFGKQIFDMSGCVGCHTVRRAGGKVGPDLTEIGDASRHLKVPTPAHHDLVEKFNGNETIAYIYESVRWPDAQPNPTKMPQFNLSDEEATALTVYLKSFVRRPTFASLVPPPKPTPPPNDPVQRGLVAYAKYCVGCHAEAGRGGVPNANARNVTIPPLNTLAGQMGFANGAEVESYLQMVRRSGVAARGADAAPPPNHEQIEQGMAAARATIATGRAVAKMDRNGPEPLSMPSWQHLIDGADTDALIYYLLSVAVWEGQSPGRGRP